MDISVVIPYRNRRECIGRTLQSFLAQPYRPLCLFLVDNGSTDGAADVCARFAARYSSAELRVTLLSQPQGGASAARNAGLARVETPWVYFFDSDDELSPDFFPAIRPLCEAAFPADIIAFPTQMRFSNGQRKTRATLPTASASTQMLSGHIATHGMVLRTDFVRAIGGWDETASQWDDWELALRLLLRGANEKWWRDRAWHTIHQHADSLTGTSFSATYDGLHRAMTIAADDIRTLTPLPRTTENRCGKRNTDTPSRALLALAFRSAIVAGQLRHEGDTTHAAEMESEAQTLCKEAGGGRAASFALTLFSRYTAHGGRAAWLLALRLLPLLPHTRKSLLPTKFVALQQTKP